MIAANLSVEAPFLTYQINCLTSHKWLNFATLSPGFFLQEHKHPFKKQVSHSSKSRSESRSSRSKVEQKFEVRDHRSITIRKWGNFSINDRSRSGYSRSRSITITKKPDRAALYRLYQLNMLCHSLVENESQIQHKYLTCLMISWLIVVVFLPFHTVNTTNMII